MQMHDPRQISRQEKPADTTPLLQLHEGKSRTKMVPSVNCSGNGISNQYTSPMTNNYPFNSTNRMNDAVNVRAGAGAGVRMDTGSIFNGLSAVGELVPHTGEMRLSTPPIEDSKSGDS